MKTRLRAERDENTCRKPLTPTEEHGLYEALLELERPKAKERRGERTDLNDSATSGKVFQHTGCPFRRSHRWRRRLNHLS